MNAVAVDGVWKFYGDYPALRDVKLEAGAGSCLALIGRNGAGKTTLLRIIAGFSRPGRGQVRIFGNPPRETETRRQIGFIGHGISVYDELSALENLTLFGRLYGLADPRLDPTIAAAVLGPLRDRVAQILPDDPLEGLTVLRAVEPAERADVDDVLQQLALARVGVARGA